ncbi:MAG: response regulator [Polyangiaceae bacterium]
MCDVRVNTPTVSGATFGAPRKSNSGALPSSSPSGVRGGPVHSPIRVLVVDDEPDSLELASTVLGGQGMLVQTAASAEEALKLLAADTPDVILSDIGMPAEDGYSLIRRVRALESLAKRSVPAIALTAFAREQDKALALAAGFNLHITKPVDISALVRCVTALANRAR